MIAHRFIFDSMFVLLLLSNRDKRLFFFLDKLNDTINTDRFAGLRVDKDVCGMHIFEVQTVADIVYSVTVTVVMETFRAYHFVNLCFGSKTLATDIRLGKDNTEQSV